MRKKALALLLAISMTAAMTAGCGSSAGSGTDAQDVAEDAAASDSAAGENDVPDAGNNAAGDIGAESAEDESAEIPDEADAEKESDEEAAGAAADAADDGSSPSGSLTSASIEDAPQLPGLTCESVLPLKYAECFNVYYYNDGFKLIDVPLSGMYLIVPEGADVPEELEAYDSTGSKVAASDLAAAGVTPSDADLTIIRQPLQNIYMAATGVMSFYDELGALDSVTMTSLDESGWTIDAPIKALQEGSMVFAGKYSTPDYEMLIDRACDLALQSTMILHTPEVQEMEEDLGIPVFIDRSSYELSALGRIEWIKLYGAMMNKEDVAEEKFKIQEDIVNSLQDFENTGKTVAFFSINSNREVVVRRTQDFIPRLIEEAGGKYVFDDLTNPGSNSASVQLNMETFYDAAVNADFLIYNGTIQEPLKSIDDLVAKDALFAEFKAVKEGNVWQVDSRWYQSTATVGSLITDLNAMITGKDDTGLVFMTKLK